MNKPLRVHTLCGGPFETNSLVLWRETSALIVDPGFLGKPLLEFCREQKLEVAAILCTHGHIDHIFDIALVSEACPKAPVGLHAADEVWAFEPKATSMFGLPPIRRPQEIQRLWKEGETYEDAGIRYSIIETPGHSPGGVCFLLEDDGVLVAGDTLFAGSIGRLDLPGGSETAMRGSLAKLMTLPDALRVLPGHGDETTIGAERRHNPYVAELLG